ncbi:MAG: RNA methyltransferase [Ferruginibacter sp.]
MNSLPKELIQSLQSIKGFNEEAFKAAHESGSQITSVRINPFKLPESKIPPLGGGGAVPWSSNGYYLPQRPSFTLDPLFHAGAYYVQEASSMFVEEVLKQTVDLTKPLKILDLCAAPGGKSTLIQSVISKESLLLSNEVIKTRVNVLSENITKWGAVNTIVTNNDPADFKRLQNYFDVIVVDAPCSGSGLFRKDPDAIEEWSEKNVNLCAQRQQRILSDVFSSLKEGGVLIYSTCSYSQQEDEEISDWLVKQFAVSSLQLAIEASWGIVETISEKEKAYGYRFYPDRVKGEGFFIAAFKKGFSGIEGYGEVKIKKSKIKSQKSKVKSKKKDILTDKEGEGLRPYLENVSDLFFIKQNEELIAMPIHLENDLAVIQSSLYIKKAGVKLGTMIRNELIPAHDLAVSTIINNNIPVIDVDMETALQYLRKEELKIQSGTKGWVLLTHQHLPIGWIKVMPNRINNYYPAAWRILNK